MHIFILMNRIDTFGGGDILRWSNWSEREDLNLRPPQPHCGALPGCATLRLTTPAGASRIGV